MTNFEKCKEEFKADHMLGNGFCHAIHRIRNENKCSDRTCENCVEWLKQEYKEPILDKAEKEYLSNIVRPFRDKVVGIMKPNRIFDPFECKYVLDGREYIVINIKNEANINLPFFKEGTMYKGMKAGKLYTLKELGI